MSPAAAISADASPLGTMVKIGEFMIDFYEAVTRRLAGQSGAR
jgi:hypothetical protein